MAVKSVLAPPHPRHDRAVVEAHHQLELHRASGPTGPPRSGPGTAAAVRVARQSVTRTVPVGVVVLGLEDERLRSVVPLDLTGADGREQEATVLAGPEQGREAGAAVEPGHAPPVDRAVASDERRRAAVTEEGVVLERGAHRCVTVIAASSGLVRSPAPRRVARRGCDAARYADDDTLGSRRRRQWRESGARRPLHRGRGLAANASSRRNPRHRRQWRVRSARSSGASTPMGPVGCTMPAVVMHGVVRTASNIDHAWIGTDARALFAKTLGRPVEVLNDADAAGVAEIRFGSARRREGRRRDGHTRHGRGDRVVRRRRARRPIRSSATSKSTARSPTAGRRARRAKRSPCRGRTGRSASTRISRSCTRCCGAT